MALLDNLEGQAGSIQSVIDAVLDEFKIIDEENQGDEPVENTVEETEMIEQQRTILARLISAALKPTLEHISNNAIVTGDVAGVALDNGSIE